MENIGLDRHQRESQLCILTEDGEVFERRIRTTPERLTGVLGPRAPARRLLEASTESEGVARHLEARGHSVIVADPNYAPMDATRSARVKTARRDARTLADALRLEADRPAHRSADRHRQVRAELAVRDTLGRTRTRSVALTKALVRREGFRLASGAAEHTLAKLAALPLPPTLTAELVPSERSSGERQRRGRITKAGNTRMRWLLVEAAWRVLRSPRADAAPLRAWAERIALRRGKRIAVVAWARRLAGVLYAMWRDGTSYAPRPASGSAAA